MKDQLQRDHYAPTRVALPWVARRSPPVLPSHPIPRKRPAAPVSIAVAIAAALLSTFTPAQAQPDPSGIDFVTIGAPGNAAWDGTGIGPDGDQRMIGRGSVGYEYRIGRFEVTTSQWVEFFNAAYDRPTNDRLPHLIPPNAWGAVGATPNTPGGRRWSVPAGREMIPVGNISWRMAAMYCNWLHNDKSTARSAFLDGAYDVSTFGYQGTFFTDQATRSPGARYWIPSLDEWTKAAHYDPNKANPDGSLGGWWMQPNGTDTRLRYGPAGTLVNPSGPWGPNPNGVPAQANGGWDSTIFPGANPFNIPLGAYANVQSPCGLFDVAGGTSEWTEGINLFAGVYPIGRVFEGSHWSSAGETTLIDALDQPGGDFPSLSTYYLGFRIATIPSVSPCVILGLCGIFLSVGRRRAKGGFHEHASASGSGRHGPRCGRVSVVGTADQLDH